MSTIIEEKETIELSFEIHCMEDLLHVVQSLSAAHDIETVMNIVRRAVRTLTHSDGATFVLRDNDFCFYAEEDAISPLWKGKRFPMDICISGWVMLHREPAIIEDIYEDSRIPIDAYRETFVKSLVTVPIKSCAPIGAIGCYWKDKHLASRKEVRILQVLADTAAIAMENISSQDSVRIKAQQLEEAIDGTLFAVAKIVEQKDPYISGHQRNVAIIGKAIAQELKLTSDQCKFVFQAGAVHDIGKIGIPSELLAKPSLLTPLELDFIKTHVKIGFDILCDIPHLDVIANITLQHHERFNGHGYPNGLKGDEILKEAQILAVADVYEAMISHRPYRPPLTKKTAYAEIKGNKGILYAPDVVDAFFKVATRNGFIID